MISFELTAGGLEVLVDGKTFGHLSQAQGFFTDPTVVKDFMRVSPEDLKTLSLKTLEVVDYGVNPEICKCCKGTPLFPNQIYSPNEGMVTCSAHPKSWL